MNIFVTIPLKFAGCGFYRQYQPHNRLAKRYENVKVLLSAGLQNGDGSFVEDEKIKEFDIVQMHKGYFHLETIEKCRKLGVVTIADFDDWWNLDTEHVFYKQSIENDEPDKLRKLLMAVDYVTCTTDRLADQIAKFNKNVVVLPNAMDMNYPNCAIDRHPEKEVVFAYLGGHCHGKDVRQLQGFSNRMTSLKGYKIRLMGVDKSEMYEEYGRILSDKGNNKSFDWMEKADVFNYPKFYNFLDVSLVPLVDNKFNSMKSELKLIEAGFFKKAVIVDDVYPYKPLLRHKQNAMVVRKYQDWYKHAKYLLENPSAITELGEALHETVQSYHIDRVNEKRYKFYKDVLAKRNINGSNRHSRVSGKHERELRRTA